MTAKTLAQSLPKFFPPTWLKEALIYRDKQPKNSKLFESWWDYALPHKPPSPKHLVPSFWKRVPIVMPEITHHKLTNEELNAQYASFFPDFVQDGISKEVAHQALEFYSKTIDKPFEAYPVKMDHNFMKFLTDLSDENAERIQRDARIVRLVYANYISYHALDQAKFTTLAVNLCGANNMTTACSLLEVAPKLSNPLISQVIDSIVGAGKSVD